jgi:hypothetical protein
VRRFLLVGPAGAVESALDRFHFLATVLGVAEREGEAEVWTEEGIEEVLPLEGVDVSELPAGGTEPELTGLEGDAPILVGDHILVRPPWVARPDGFGGIDLVVPRGMAFGSGEHASTRAALLAMDDLWTGKERSFADVGTGSGILALYARARGVPRILACDLDEAAVRAARELVPGACVVLGGPDALAERVDFVAANLNARELIAAMPGLLRLWNHAAALVLSGIRDDEREHDHEFECVLRATGLEPVVVHRVDGFLSAGFTGVRR